MSWKYCSKKFAWKCICKKGKTLIIKLIIVNLFKISFLRIEKSKDIKIKKILTEFMQFFFLVCDEKINDKK